MGLDRRIANTRDGKPVWSDPVAAAEKEHPLHPLTVASRPERPKPQVSHARPTKRKGWPKKCQPDASSSLLPVSAAERAAQTHRSTSWPPPITAGDSS